jgi:hypothetical protein
MASLQLCSPSCLISSPWQPTLPRLLSSMRKTFQTTACLPDRLLSSPRHPPITPPACLQVNSARPDGVSHIPEKTPCIGVGLRSVFDQDFNMRLGPVWIADDMPEVGGWVLACAAGLCLLRCWVQLLGAASACWADGLQPPWLHCLPGCPGLQVYVDNYRDAIFAVPAYKPVANKPTTYDADGSVLRGMGPAIMRYWQHCYGADGCGGAVAALTAAAREALHQLSWVPLVLEPAAAAAGQPGEGTAEGPAEAAAAQGAPEGEAVPLAGCQGLNKLFRDQEALSTAISVHAFLEQEVRGCACVWQSGRQQMTRASWLRKPPTCSFDCLSPAGLPQQPVQPPNLHLCLPLPPLLLQRALLPAPVDEAVPMVEDAVPCQPAAGHENDENSSLQTTVGVRLASGQAGGRAAAHLLLGLHLSWRC